MESMAWIKKISEGCDYCYMYILDKRSGRGGRDIYRNKGKITHPMWHQANL